MTKNELIEACRIAESGRLEAERKLYDFQRALMRAVVDAATKAYIEGLACGKSIAQ